MLSLAKSSRTPLLALLALFFALSAAPLSTGPAVAGEGGDKKFSSPSPSTSSGRDAARQQDRRMNDMDQSNDEGGDGGGGGGSH